MITILLLQLSAPGGSKGTILPEDQEDQIKVSSWCKRSQRWGPVLQRAV